MQDNIFFYCSVQTKNMANVGIQKICSAQEKKITVAYANKKLWSTLEEILAIEYRFIQVNK